MFRNINYIENGPELSCHEQLYRDGQRKLARQQQLEYERAVAHLKELLAEPNSPSPRKISRDFYHYAMEWKNQVKQKHFSNQYTDQQQSVAVSKSSQLKLPSNYISPIQGWKEHARHYQEKRTIQVEESNYQPSINERSKMMSFNEPVEDRLLRYGQEKEERLQYEKQWERFYLEVEMSQKQRRGNDDVFERLYNFEKKEPVVEQHSLVLNKLSPEREERVRQRRQQYSLYENPKRHQPVSTTPEVVPRVLSPNEFDEFLRRNFQRPLPKHEQWEEEEDEEYTFKPELNKKSLEIANKTGESMLERQQRQLEKRNILKQQQQQIENTELHPKVQKIHVNNQTNQTRQQAKTGTFGNSQYDLRQLIK